MDWLTLIRQTSSRSANLLDMGKGFRATEGLLGQDLSELIMAPCRKRVSFDPRQSARRNY